MTKKQPRFDTEEREILDAIERDALSPVPFSKQELRDLQDAAKRTFAKTRTINIRISERDLLRLKAKAAREGIPYQTLISSTLHKHADSVAEV